MNKMNLYMGLLGTSLFVNTVVAQDGIPLKGKELFGDLKARQIGPALMSGRVTDIEGHPTNNKILYIGTAGGGVWKSNDGGVIFYPIFDDYNQSIGTVAVDPSKPDLNIWVGTGEVWTRNSTSAGDGIYKSVDGGQNWTNMGLPNSERISSIEIHPQNSDVVYVGVLGALWGDSEDRGVYKTSDGGKTWEKILYVNTTTGCADLVMDPNNPDVLYASFWEFRRTAWSFNSGGVNSALYKSIDGGKTWNKIHVGFPTGQLGRIAVNVAPSNSNILYSVVEAEKDSEKGLYRSEDAGATWKHLNGDFGLTVRPFYFSRIVIDPRNPDVIVKAGLTGSISRDGGKTFRNAGFMHGDIHDIWFDNKESDRMYFATDGGLYRSLNGGTTLEIIENLPLSQFYHVSIDNQEPYLIYGGLQDNGSWFGPSSSPGGIEGRDWESIGAGDGFRVYPHPTKPWIIYSEMQGAENIWRYDHKKRQTAIINPLPVIGDPKLRFNWNAPISTSKHNADRIYAGSQFLHKSDDMGNTWVKISPDLTTNDKNKQNQENSGGLSADNSGAENHCTIFTIAESPLNENIIWVGTDDGNVQVTTDGGKQWTNVTKNIQGLPANTWCYHIEASVFDKGIAYAVFDGHTGNDKTPYAYKTTDYGKTWKSIISQDVKGFVRSIQEDYLNQNLLFLGTELGLYITVDGGMNWSKFSNNMPSVPVHYMDLHPKTNDLVMATHGRGVIILDNITPLREINSDILNKELVFFTSKPFEMPEESTFGGTSGETQFVGPNPSSSAKIMYYLSKRHTFGKMTMDVYNDKNEWITSLVPGKQKGINVVEWDFNMKTPKVATGKTFDFGGLSAPRVPAGKYKIVITKGNNSFETFIEVVYKSNSVFTLDDRKIQQEVTLKLYKMTEDLAYLVYTIDEWIKHAEGVIQTQSALKKVGTTLVNELNNLKNTLVITKGDNYVGAAEPQLREDIGDLYGVVVNYYGRPSQSQMDNLALIETRMKEAMEKFSKIENGSLAKYKSAVVKSIDLPGIKTKEEYLKKD